MQQVYLFSCWKTYWYNGWVFYLLIIIIISEKNSVVVENRGVEGGGEKSRVECAEDIVMENDGAIW